MEQQTALDLVTEWFNIEVDIVATFGSMGLSPEEKLRRSDAIIVGLRALKEKLIRGLGSKKPLLEWLLEQDDIQGYKKVELAFVIDTLNYIKKRWGLDG